VKSAAILSERPSSKVNVLCDLGLFCLTALSRITFQSQILYHWDSVNFANAMRHFDMLQEHPQPPGYIVYVWLCRLVDLLFQDTNATMVWISILASSLAVVILYHLGRAMWGQRTGFIAALLLASSPLFWFYGEIALPHTLDTFLVLLGVWLLFQIRQGEVRLLWPAVVLLALAGGVRQQTLVFLLPLALYAVWGVGWKRILLAALLGTAACLVWFVPLMSSCGGIAAYLEKTSTFSERFQRTTSIIMRAGWGGVAHNLRKLGLYTAYGMGSALLPLGVYGLARLVRRSRPRQWGKAVFLGLWVAPALLFYGLVHMGQQGLVFVFLPTLLLLGAVATERLTKNWEPGGWVVVAFLVLINTLGFSLAPEYPLGPGTQRILTRDTLSNSDHYYLERFAAIREHFAPEGTAVIALNWSHPEYYLPEYALLRVDQIASDGETRFVYRQWPGRAGTLSAGDLSPQGDPNAEVTLVLFDPDLEELVDAKESLRLTLPSAGELTHLRLKPGQVLLYRPDALAVGERGN